MFSTQSWNYIIRGSKGVRGYSEGYRLQRRNQNGLLRNIIRLLTDELDAELD